MKYTHGGDIYTYEGLLDFSANINPFGTPANVLQAAVKSLELVKQYPDPYCRELKAAIEKEERINKNFIICGNGAADLIFQIVMAKKPKKAVLVTPSFTEYQQALESVNTDISYYNLREENKYQIDEEILDYLKADIDIMFLCNPNNPIGNTISIEILEKILKRCREKEIILVIDECFNDFLESPHIYSMKHKIEEYKNLFIIKAFTKMYAMAGLRLGYGFCSNGELLEKIERVRQPWSVSIPAQVAGIEALKDKEFPEKTRNYIKKERAYLCDSMERMEITYWKPEANYIFFQARADLKDLLLQKGILIRDCSNYFGLKEGYFRIAVKNRDENERIIHELSKIMKHV